MLTINLLQALPSTPLWDRLAAAGRLRHDPTRESNADFLRPYDDVVAMWRHCIREAYEPEAIYFFFSSRRRHTRSLRDWSSDVCSSDLLQVELRMLLREIELAVGEGPGEGARQLVVRSGNRNGHDEGPGGHHRHVGERRERSEERRVGKECRSRGSA